MNLDIKRGLRAEIATESDLTREEKQMIKSIMDSVVRYADKANEVRGEALRNVGEALMFISTAADIDKYIPTEGENK